MDQTLSGQLNFAPRPKTVDELYFLAYMDPLTGTYNRNVLEEMREYLDSQALFVTMVDMDNLKTINDRQGHAAGDQAICDIAERLKQISEAVFRLGGDEFLLLDRKGIDPGVVLGISYGSIWKVANEPLSRVMKQADKLMYEDKHKKKIEQLKAEVNAAFGVPKSILESVEDTGYRFFASTFVKGGADEDGRGKDEADGLSRIFFE